MRKRFKRGKKKFSKIPKKFLFLIFGFLILLIFLVIFKTGIFLIKDVEINFSNTACVDSKLIEPYVKLNGQNFFFFDFQKLKKDIVNKFICVKDVNITRFFPSKVRIDVLGRDQFVTLVDFKKEQATPSALLENLATPSAQADQADIFIVDKEGVVFSSELNESLPKIYLYQKNLSLGQRLEKGLITNCLKILDKIKTLGIEVRESVVYSDKYLFITSTPKIIFNLNNDIDAQLASLQLILGKAKIDSEQLDFVDLRFEKAVVKFIPKKK